MLRCEDVIEGYGPDGEIIGGCHPRNFFCCNYDEGLIFPDKNFQGSDVLIYQLPQEKYEPLPVVDGCPEGWACDPDVRNYNQYDDAAEPLKELLACMREILDRNQLEKRIKSNIGRISSISDSRLYRFGGTCKWESGPIKPDNNCRHIYPKEEKSGKCCSHIYTAEKVSAHYGGPGCRDQRKSYAIDFGDEENADYIIPAAKVCEPRVYVNYRTPGHYDHIHISIGEIYGCRAK